MAASKPEFIQRLFDEQATPLLKYLTSRFRNGHDAEEVAQEAWLRMYRLDHPEELNNPKAFLFQTASNLAVDRMRRAGLEARFAEQEKVTRLEDAHASAERAATAAESIAMIEAVLRGLPSKTRQAFIMHRNRDMSYPEIAKALGVSTSMVEKYIIAALKAFRSRLGTGP